MQIGMIGLGRMGGNMVERLLQRGHEVVAHTRDQAKVQKAVQSGALVLVLREFEPPPSPVSLVHAGGRLLPLKVRAFLDFAAPRLKVRLTQGAL